MNRRSIPAAAATTVFTMKKQALTESCSAHNREHSEAYLPRLSEADFSHTTACVQAKKVWMAGSLPQPTVSDATGSLIGTRESSLRCCESQVIIPVAVPLQNLNFEKPVLQTLELPEEAKRVCDD